MSAKFAHLGPLRDVVALDRLEPIHRVVVNLFRLVVVLLADGRQLLGTVVTNAAQVLDLARVALVDALHLLDAVLSNALDLF